TPNPWISLPYQEVGRFSSLVTRLPVEPPVASAAGNLDGPHARPAHVPRAAARESSLGSRASVTSAVGWLSYWPPGSPVPSNISAAHVCVHRSEITFGSPSIGVVCSSSQAQEPSRVGSCPGVLPSQ